MNYSLKIYEPYNEAVNKGNELKKAVDGNAEKLNELQVELTELETKAADLIASGGEANKQQNVMQSIKETRQKIQDITERDKIYRTALGQINNTIAAEKKEAEKLLKGMIKEKHEKVMRKIVTSLKDLAACYEEEQAMAKKTLRALGSTAFLFTAFDCFPVRESELLRFVKTLGEKGYEI